MTYLHYGSEVRIHLSTSATKMVTEQIGAHASRGGWVTIADVDGVEWTFLVTAGVPIWLNTDE